MASYCWTGLVCSALLLWSTRKTERGAKQFLTRWAVLAAPFALLTGCAAHADLQTYSVVPNFTLTDQTGAKFNSAAALRGQVWIAGFIFTNCSGPCPRMSAQMHEVQTALAGSDGVKLVSFTVDPERDTPAVLAGYSNRYQAQPGRWFFLTGSQETLNNLSRKAFMLGDVNGSLEHSTRFVLIDRASRVRGFYLTSDQDAIPRLISDTKNLLKESL